MRRLNPAYFLIFALGLVIGFAVKHFTIGSVEVDSEINIVDTCSVLVTLFLAFYIPTVLERGRDKQRFVKETVIKRIEALGGLFSNTSQIVSGLNGNSAVSQDVKDEITGNFVRISNELKVLLELLDEIKVSQNVKSKAQGINQLRRQYKNIVTGGRFDTSNFVYSAQQKVNEAVKFTEISKELSLLVLLINSLDI